MKQTTPPEAPTNHTLKTWLIVAASVVGGFIAINALIWVAYIGRAYPGVKAGSLYLGNLDTSAARVAIAKYTQDYRVTITVADQPQTVTAGDVGLVFDIPASAQTAISAGKHYVVPLYGLIDTWRQGRIALAYSLDDIKLAEVSSRLAGPGSVAATDARVVIEGQTVRVEAAKNGQGIDHATLTKLIKDTFAQGLKTAQISEGVTEPAVTTAEATKMVTVVTKTLTLPLSVQVNGKIFTPDATEIGKWITVAPNTEGELALTANQEAINAYVNTVAGQVDAKAVNKQINMVNGVVRTVNEGKNGLALDKTALGASLSKALTTGVDTAITGVMTPVAFKTVTNNTVDLEGKYIEINLSRQHLWAYDNKQLVFESAITSGATGAGFATIQGLFSIKAKQTNRNLNGYAIGYNYNVFVNYWMPFSGNYGMHDASWRTSFGGSDYYYGGSHGCVNLPAATAAWIYNFVNVGTPVWVHS